LPARRDRDPALGPVADEAGEASGPSSGSGAARRLEGIGVAAEAGYDGATEGAGGEAMLDRIVVAAGTFRGG